MKDYHVKDRLRLMQNAKRLAVVGAVEVGASSRMINLR